MMRCVVVLLALSSLAIAAEPDGFGVNKGLVLHLTFDQAGKQALDKSPKKNHAAVHNAKFIEKGRFGGAYSLDGRGDYLRIPNSPSIEIRDAVTVAVWVNLHSFGPKGYANENGYIVNKGDDYWWNPAIGLGYSKGAQKPLFHIGSPAARQTGIKTNVGVTKLQSGKWYHLVGTYDGAVSKLYVNGKLENSLAFKRRMRADKAPVLLGGGHLGSGEFRNQFTVDATLDNVMIWNRALDADEVKSIALGAPMGVPHILREAKHDRVVLKDGTMLKGRISNNIYTMTVSGDKIGIPAARVIGMSAGDKAGTMRVVLTDSQVIVVTTPGRKLDIDVSGSKLSSSFSDIVQCGYRITPAKGANLKFEGMMATLKDGSRLLVSDFKTKLQITTDYCKLEIRPERIVSVSPADEKGSRHTVLLAGGSKLTGVLGPKDWSAGYVLNTKRSIRLGELSSLTVRGVKQAQRFGLIEMRMRNGDVLYGKLDAKGVGIRTGFGEISPQTGAIKSIAVDPAGKPPVVMTMRSGAVYRGELTDKHLPLVLWIGDSAATVSPAHVASMTWAPAK
ncbi:MAG: LamG domain-containing protein [Phycisphaerae bacterium]|nr:LamG domain-containing protein [Phycisphaerae bacterium]